MDHLMSWISLETLKSCGYRLRPSGCRIVVLWPPLVHLPGSLRTRLALWASQSLEQLLGPLNCCWVPATMLEHWALFTLRVSVGSFAERDPDPSDTVTRMALKMPIYSIIKASMAVRGILGLFHELISHSLILNVSSTCDLILKVNSRSLHVDVYVNNSGHDNNGGSKMAQECLFLRAPRLIFHFHLFILLIHWLDISLVTLTYLTRLVKIG